MRVLTLGIAGGSGSGKTTVAQKIIDVVGPNRISFIEMDCYYKDLSHLNKEERALHNFDHPGSLDMELFLEHIKLIKSGVEIKKPVYDFVNHVRTEKYTVVKPHPVVILEGILLYENSLVREQVDIKTFIDTPSDIRFIRRLIRDMQERGRLPESIVHQYYNTVRPMHMTFVEPTREHADIIIPWQGYNEVAIDMVISRVEQSLKKRENEEGFIAGKNITAENQTLTN